jgi:hypothetical protein
MQKPSGQLLGQGALGKGRLGFLKRAGCMLCAFMFFGFASFSMIYLFSKTHSPILFLCFSCDSSHQPAHLWDLAFPLCFSLHLPFASTRLAHKMRRTL